MTDLKIPNLNNKPKNFLFRNKIPLVKKSKYKLIRESILMLILGIAILCINFYIPSQELLFDSFNNNLLNIYGNIVSIAKYSLQVILVIFLVLSKISAFILLLGSFYRIIRILKIISRKTSKAIFRR